MLFGHRIFQRLPTVYAVYAKVNDLRYMRHMWTDYFSHCLWLHKYLVSFRSVEQKCNKRQITEKKLVNFDASTNSSFILVSCDKQKVNEIRIFVAVKAQFFTTAKKCLDWNTWFSVNADYCMLTQKNVKS